MSPRRGSKPRRTDRLVVGRNMTLINDRFDLSSEGAHDIGKTVNVKPKLKSGHETHMGLESRTYWPTDPRS
jgi:hypothetical protein